MKVNIEGKGMVPGVGVIAPIANIDVTESVLRAIINMKTLRAYDAETRINISKANIDSVIKKYNGIEETAAVETTPEEVVETVSETLPEEPVDTEEVVEETKTTGEEEVVETEPVDVEEVEETKTTAEEETVETTSSNNNSSKKNKKKR